MTHRFLPILRFPALRSARRGLIIALLALGTNLTADRALAVDSPPQLNDFQILTPTVDSSVVPALVQFSANISDVAPGVCTVACDDLGGPSQVALRHPATGQRYAARFQSISGNAYSAAITLPITSAGGAWEVESIWLADLAGNRQLLSRAAIAAAGFATSVQNGSATGDVTAPALTDVSVDPLAFDATTGQTVTVKVGVSETGSGLCASGCQAPGGPSQVRFVSATTGQLRDGLLAAAGDSTYLASVSFPPGSATGQWTVASLRLVDVAGNRASFNRATLVGLGFVTDLSVTSSVADLVAPRLISASSSPYPIDTTASGLTATYAAVAQDATSGLCLDFCDDFGTSSQVLYRRFGSNQVRFGLLGQLTGDPFNGSFEALVPIPVSSSANVWYPERLMLADVAGNRVFVPEPGAQAITWIAPLVFAICGRFARARH